MRRHNIPLWYRKSEILIMPSDLALSPTGSNYPCLELIFMFPKVFEPLKFDCILREREREREREGERDRERDFSCRKCQLSISQSRSSSQSTGISKQHSEYF